MTKVLLSAHDLLSDATSPLVTGWALFEGLSVLGLGRQWLLVP